MNWGFQCAGVVDGTHIPIVSPTECPADVRVFVNSSLYRRGQDGTLFPDWKETICGNEIPLLVLGDPAYPLLSWFMKAFPDNGSLSCPQKT